MKNRIFISVLVLLILCLVGCGGGTSGTGVTSFEGSAKLAVTGAPLSGALVTARSSQASAQTTTSVSGAFALSLAAEKGEAVEFEFILDAQSIRLSIEAPAGDENSVSVIVEIDPAQGTARVISRRESRESQDPINSDDSDNSTDRDRDSGSANQDSIRDDRGGDNGQDRVSDQRGNRGDSSTDRSDGTTSPGESGGGSVTDGGNTDSGSDTGTGNQDPVGRTDG